MATVLKTAEAERDLIDIWHYLAREHDATRANSFLRNLDQKISAPAVAPGIGRPREELRTGLRSFPFKPYLIFYHPMPGGLILVRVLHGRRDLDALFGEEPE